MPGSRHHASHRSDDGMTNPQGIIVSVSAGRAVVSVEGGAVCPRCAEGRGCGAGLYGQSRGGRLVDARIPGGLQVDVGDTVRLVIAPRDLLGASLLAYGLPLAGLLLGALAAAGMASAPGDAVAVALAGLGLGAGLVLGRWRLRRAGCVRRFEPVVELPA